MDFAGSAGNTLVNLNLTSGGLAPQYVGRPEEVPFAHGVFQRQQAPEDSAYRTVHDQDSKGYGLPRAPGMEGQFHRLTQSLRSDTNATRNRFLSEVQAQARAQNGSSIQQKIEDRKRVYEAVALGHSSSTWEMENEAREVRENFTSPGTLLNEHEQPTLLLENKYMPSRVLQAEHSREFKEGFRRWFETQRDNEERRERVAPSSMDKLRTNNYNAAFGKAPSSSTGAPGEGDTNANQLTNSHESERLNKPRITYQLIDSSNRDLSLYPAANDFIIALSRKFINVKRVKLISTEIPNTDVIVRGDPSAALLVAGGILTQCNEILNDANNNFYWIDEADGTEPGNYNCIVYDVQITPGNYVSVMCSCNEITLAAQIELQVSMINRYTDGTAHEFQVTVNPQTNVTTVHSVKSITLEVNPIRTTGGTNLVTVAQLNQPFAINDVITISGSSGVGGLSASTINGVHQISAVTTNTFSFRVNANATQSASGGGANVLSGQERPIMLLASNLDTPFSSILGFPQQDSAQQIATAITYIERNPRNPANPSAVTHPGEFPAQLTAPHHGLMVGDQIVIVDTNTIPSINGLQTVTNVISADVFEIGKIVKVVNNQTVVTQTLLGYVRQSLDTQLTAITELTTAQQGFICTQYAHNLSTTPPDNLVWLGNLIGGLTRELTDLNGVHTVGEVQGNQCFDITGGLIYPGTDTGNAFVVKTTSTALQAITNVIPANNGRFTPVSTAAVYTGTDVPRYVLFANTETTPNVNFLISRETDNTSDCSDVVIKARGEAIWQSWTASVDEKLVGIYLKCGEGAYGEVGQLQIYDGLGTSGTLLATSSNAPMDRDVCEGAYFCFSLHVQALHVYTFSLQLLTALEQKCSLCVTVAPPASNIGISDLGGNGRYEFVTYVSPGVQEINYYSQTSGIFDLTTPISSVAFQNPNQAYVRSLDSELRCIQNALPASNGIWTFSTAHGLSAGDHVLVRVAVPPYSTSEPYVQPNVAGLLTVNSVIDARRLDMTLTISDSTYGDGSVIDGAIQLQRTLDLAAKPIVNLYPASTGYLCKDIVSCDPMRQICRMCAGDMIIIRGTAVGSGNVYPYCDLVTLDADRNNAYIENVYGCYRVNQIYSNVSSACHDIFDLVLPHIAAATTAVSVASNNDLLPQSIINVDSVAGFNAAGGTVSIAGDPHYITYSGLNNAATTVAPASNGVALPAATINVASTVGFSGGGGIIVVVTTLGAQAVFFSGTTATSFTGCLGGAGVMTTGNAVTQTQLTGCVGGLGTIVTGESVVEVLRYHTAVASTSIAPASDMVNLPTPTINVVSTSGFNPNGGTLSIAGSTDLIHYTGLTPTSFTGCSGGSIVMLLGQSVVVAPVNYGESAVLDTSKCIVDGQNGIFNVASVFFESANVIIEDSSHMVIYNGPSFLAEALCCRTMEPHGLHEGDAIYLTLGSAPGCTLTAATYGEPLLPQADNVLAFPIPDAMDPTVFKIYGLGVVSGNIPPPPYTLPPPPYAPVPFPGVNDVQFYYHKICGDCFTPIVKFYPKSYYGMLEVPNHGYSGNTTGVFLGDISSAPNIGGCDTAVVIDENFLTLTSLGASRSVDPMPFISGPVFPPSLVEGDLGFSLGIEVLLELTDDAEAIAQKLTNALTNFTNDQVSLGVLESPSLVGDMLLILQLATSVTTLVNLLLVNQIGFALDVFEGNDVNTGFLISTIQQGGTILAPEATSIAVNQTGVQMNVSPTTNVNYAPGEPARYFTFGSTGIKQGTTNTTGAAFTLPQATINVASTAGWPTSGTFRLLSTATLDQIIISYTGVTPTSFTGCSIYPGSGGGGVNIPSGTLVYNAVYYKLYVYFPVALTVRTGNVGHQYAGQLVGTPTSEGCAPLIPVQISAANNGVIMAPNSFVGGECLYFLNNCNLNLDGENALANNFFTVSTKDLSSTQFSLNVPITNFGPITANGQQSCQTFVFDAPGQYQMTTTASRYDIILAGAGGGSGLDFTSGTVGAGQGGAGGLVVGTIDVPYNAKLHVFVGGAGGKGQNGSASSGGFNGGGDSGPQPGLGGGAGGGATDLRVGGTTLADRIAVAGGGGGGTGAYRDFSIGDIAGQNGGNGGGLVGQAGSGTAAQQGLGGTQLAGGAGGIEPPKASYGGALGLGGGPPDGAGVISATSSLNFFGGGGGFYGGGTGATTLYDGSDNGMFGVFLAGGGGGSSLAPVPGTASFSGLGAKHDSDGYALLRPQNIAIFEPQGNNAFFTFTVPANATRVTINCLGAGGGNGFPGAAPFAGMGAKGGRVQASFMVGGSSLIQPGTKLNVITGLPGQTGIISLTDTIAFGGGNGGFGFLGGGGGGGSSEVRLFTTNIDGGQFSLLTEANKQSLLISAGGGGGGGAAFTSGGFLDGGAGGGLQGQDAQGLIASGGTQFAGGGGGSSGSFLFGGVGVAQGAAGGGGGFYGGGSGIALSTYSGLGGGGGSGYVTPNGETADLLSVIHETGNGANAESHGSVIITWETSMSITIPVGHFVQTPCPSPCTPCGGQFVNLQLIEQRTNGLFCSANVTEFAAGNVSVLAESTCVLLTTDNYNAPGKVISVLQDVIAHAVAFPTPAPLLSETKFETNLIIAPNDLSIGGVPIGLNTVDPVSTRDLRYPGIYGLGWIIAKDCLKNPIVSIGADSKGTFGPVIPGLKVGDSIYMESIQPTEPDLNGVHTVSYVDTGNGIAPQYFELSDVRLTETGGPVATGNIYAFRTPPNIVGNAAPDLLAINGITANTCPTILTVTNSPYTVGSFINLYVKGTNTTPSLNSIEGTEVVRDIIQHVRVLSNNNLELPTTDNVGNSLCNITVNNQTSIVITPLGSRFSKQFLSTNCGKAVIQPDPGNNRTIIFCPERSNLARVEAISIISTTPHITGVSTVLCATPIPPYWIAGVTVTVSGQQLGNPYIQGSFKIFNIGVNSFDIISNAGPGATGGTGGYASGPAAPSIPGHGLETGNLVRIDAQTEPPIGPVHTPNVGSASSCDTTTWPVFSVTVLDATHFSIPYLVSKVLTNGSWCSDLITAHVPNHGLAEGDIVFVYGATAVGGLVDSDINTFHGPKIKNIPTNDELATRKIVRVLDGDTFQFAANYGAFPTARDLAGGFQVCFSAKNHTLSEVADGYKNYGFNATQSNQNCLGQVQTYLNFSNLSYILMTSDVLTRDDANPIVDTGQVQNIFAKIQLAQAPGSVMFNTFIGGERIFYEPIARLDQIDVQLARPDNTRFDLRGQNYAFALEIEEYQDRQRTANKSSRRGLNDPGLVGQLGLVEATISRENPAQNLGMSGVAVGPALVAAATGLASATGQ
jgi:hypothetical protein